MLESPDYLALSPMPACQPAARVLVLPILHHESSVNIRFRVWKYEPSLVSPSIQLSSSPTYWQIAFWASYVCNAVQCAAQIILPLASFPARQCTALTQKISYFYGHCNAIKRSCSARSPRCLFLPLPTIPISSQLHFLP